MVWKSVFLLHFLCSFPYFVVYIQHTWSRSPVLVMEDGDVPRTPISSPVFAVFFPDDMAKSPRDLYSTAKEAAKMANTPEGKTNGARFRRFGTPQQALDFLTTTSSDCVSPLSRPQESKIPVASEPVIPFPSLTMPQLTAFKKVIENSDFEKFDKLVSENPRYLINPSGDMAPILMMGQRYNALHISAKGGNHEAIEKILELVSDPKFIARLYDTDISDALFRRENIISSYLNTPDKGNFDTPLHLAAKFGKLHVVAVLMKQPLIDKTLRNKEDLLAVDVACARYHNEDKAGLKAKIELSIGGLYVACYRTPDYSLRTKLIITEGFPEKELSKDRSMNKINNLPYSPITVGTYYLSSVAGPFKNKDKANSLYHEWMSSGTDTKRSDGDKGYERVGRELARKHSAGWREVWSFLGTEPVDLGSTQGMDLLNTHLNRLASDSYKNDNDIAEMGGVKRRLSFSDEDAVADSETEEDGEHFMDASDVWLEGDSLDGLSDLLNGMQLNTPDAHHPADKRIKDDYGIDASGDTGGLEDEFITPPSSPAPVFLHELPTKADNDLYLALCGVNDELLDSYPRVRFYMENMIKYDKKDRFDWPSLDSPRRQRTPKRLTRF